MDKYLFLNGEWISKAECERLIKEFADSVLDGFDEVFPEGIK